MCFFDRFMEARRPRCRAVMECDPGKTMPVWCGSTQGPGSPPVVENARNCDAVRNEG